MKDIEVGKLLIAETSLSLAYMLKWQRCIRNKYRKWKKGQFNEAKTPPEAAMQLICIGVTSAWTGWHYFISSVRQEI